MTTTAATTKRIPPPTATMSVAERAYEVFFLWKREEQQSIYPWTMKECSLRCDFIHGNCQRLLQEEAALLRGLSDPRWSGSVPMDQLCEERRKSRVRSAILKEWLDHYTKEYQWAPRVS